MEENNIMNNEEVMETTGEIVEETCNGGFKTAAIVGLGVIASAAAYKYVLKPTGAKIKTWYKNRKTKKQDVVDADIIDVEETEDDSEE